VHRLETESDHQIRPLHGLKNAPANEPRGCDWAATPPGFGPRAGPMRIAFACPQARLWPNIKKKKMSLHQSRRRHPRQRPCHPQGSPPADRSQRPGVKVIDRRGHETAVTDKPCACILAEVSSDHRRRCRNHPTTKARCGGQCMVTAPPFAVCNRVIRQHPPEHRNIRQAPSEQGAARRNIITALCLRQSLPRQGLARQSIASAVIPARDEGQLPGTDRALLFQPSAWQSCEKPRDLRHDLDNSGSAAPRPTKKSPDRLAKPLRSDPIAPFQLVRHHLGLAHARLIDWLDRRRRGAPPKAADSGGPDSSAVGVGGRSRTVRNAVCRNAHSSASDGLERQDVRVCRGWGRLRRK